MTIEQLMAINNVSKVTVTPGTVLSAEPTDILIEKIGKLIDNDIRLVKDYIAPVASTITKDMEQRVKAMQERDGFKEPELVYIDVPEHIIDLNNMRDFKNMSIDLSSVAQIFIPWTDNVYDEIFMGVIKPDDVLYRDFRNSVSRADVKRVWEKYLGSGGVDIPNALSNLSSFTKETNETINDIYILDILGKSMGRNTLDSLTHDVTINIALALTAAANNAIIRRLNAMDNVSDSQGAFYGSSVIDDITYGYVTKGNMLNLTHKGGTVDMVKHFIYLNPGVTISVPNLITDAAKYAELYKEKVDNHRVKTEQEMQGRLVSEYIQAVTTASRGDNKDGLMVFNNDTIIVTTVEYLNSLDFYDVYDIKKVSMGLAIEVFFKDTNARLVTDTISTYTSKGINLNTATVFAVEDLAIKYLSKMYTIE